ncbi:hypothetical protein [Rickettsia sp.]|uniref:hypothetical protein n=1 Tax=Rickettsia sp. TaxID=789 RepID=UPI00397E6378
MLHSSYVILAKSGNPYFFVVIPWLDHGIQKNNKNTNNFSIFNWIPWSSHGMTEVKLIHARMT